jgi:hypothetical protein
MRRSVLIIFCSSIIASSALLSGCAHEASALNQNGSVVGGANSRNGANSNTGNVLPGPTPSPSLLPPAGPVDPSFKMCNPYYPLVPGSHALFAIKRPTTGPVGAVNVTVDSADEKGKKVFTEVAKRLSVKGMGTGLEITTRKYVCDGEKIQVISNVIDVTNPTGKSGRLDGKFPATSVVMMAPSSLTAAAAWSYAMDADMKVPDKSDPKHEKMETKHDTFQLTFEVKGQEDVTVPAGTFHAIRIGVKVNGKDSDEYYARGIGLVRRSLSDGTVWELTEYNGLTPMDK